MANHEQFDELAAVYALGALDGPDLETFLAHLRAGCAECERLIADDEDTLLRAAGEWATPPPAQVRRDLFARIDGPASASSPKHRTGWLPIAAGMALAAGIAALAVGAALRAQHAAELARVEREADALRTDLAKIEREAQGLRTDLASEREVRALLDDPATRFVRLGGLPPSPKAEARVAWHPQKGGIFLAKELPPAPPGKAYELWAIAGGKPRPAGVFKVDASGVGRVKVPPLEDAPVDVFAVTLEPEAGVPAPTGAMYLASS